MVMDHREHMVTRFRTSLTLLIAPVEYAVNWPYALYDKIADSLTSHQALVEENTTLRAQQLLLLGQLQKLQALQQENLQLRALLQSSSKTKSEKLLAAQVLAINIGPFVDEMILNKGSKDGAYIGQPVIDASGIMGQIIQVDPLTSRLLLISDTRSALPVRNNRNGLYGIVDGQGNLQNLAWVNAPITADIKVGDVLVSSGLGGHFPEGYPVGTVTSVIHRPGDSFAGIAVAPAAQINSSQHVLLVWPVANAVSQDNAIPFTSAKDNKKITLNQHMKKVKAGVAA